MELLVSAPGTSDALRVGMFLVAPLIVFSLQAPAPAPADVSGAAAAVAEALADADQIVRVHEAPGAIVFDLDRAGELFQLTVAIDDDGRVTSSVVDWAGPTGHLVGIAPTELAHLSAVERIDVDATRHVILRGDGRDIALAIVARS
jgi:hypothetical protein